MIVYRELSSLVRDLGFRAKTLYAVSNSIPGHYRTRQIPKKSGGTRRLSVPDEILKSIQRSIADVLLFDGLVSIYARAYKLRASTLKNARPHVGKPVVLKLDILHFFDSIQYTMVKERVFPPERYSETIRVLLAMLCCNGGSLPQGAPSSPAITNILMCPFDELVGPWCKKQGIEYTRYCDDMTFSGDFDPYPVIEFVRAELKKMGFLLNGQKTRVQRAGTRQTVTGIVVNERARVPSDYRRKLRQEIYFCRKYGVEEHLKRISVTTPESLYIEQLMGRVNYVLQIDPHDRFMEEARQWLRKLP